MTAQRADRLQSEYFVHLEDAVATGLDEDLGPGYAGPKADVTTAITVDERLVGRAVVVAKAAGVVCGTDALATTFGRLGGDVDVTVETPDGTDVTAGTHLAVIEGRVATILTGERTALNLLGHLSGISTVTKEFVRRADGVDVTCTRKTLPGLRALQKYAVRMGGGYNHRFGLYDAVLIKDNHIVAAGGIRNAIKSARRATHLPIQVECAGAAEAHEAIASGADLLLLDNFAPSELASAVPSLKETDAGILLEASGGVTLETVGHVAATGVDRISVGALTHSAPALDVSLKLVEA